MPKVMGRFPFVSKQEILDAYRPGGVVSDSAFRTLRLHHLVSEGADYRIHSGGRIRGQLRYYAALNVDAARLARLGEKDVAVEIAAEAKKIEDKYEPALLKVLETLGVTNEEDLLDSRDEIAIRLKSAITEQEKIRAKFSKALGSTLVERFARIVNISGSLSTLSIVIGGVAEATTSPAWLEAGATLVAVNTSLMERFRLGVGDLTVLRLETLGAGSLVSLLPAYTEEDDGDDGLTPSMREHFAGVPDPVGLRARVEARRTKGDVIRVPEGAVVLAS